MPGPTALNGSIAELIYSAGPLAKFVLIVLALFSVISWALIVEKWWEFRRIRRESERFLEMFRDARRFSLVFGTAKKLRGSPLAQLYAAGGQEVARVAGGVELADHLLEETDEGLSPDVLDAVSRAMRRTAAAEIARMER
ncbi:MAG TPA: hypothetical protein VFN71_06515, partial [Methylomirabilota bacterium]|nr:hypothetical protein [Methylomirabilota bacterium]